MNEKNNWDTRPGGINFISEEQRREFEEWKKPMNQTLRLLDNIVSDIDETMYFVDEIEKLPYRGVLKSMLENRKDEFRSIRDTLIYLKKESGE